MSQARVGGMGGAYSVDYNVLPFLFAVFEVPFGEWENYLDKLSVLVEIQLRYWNQDTPKPDSSERDSSGI